MNCLWTKILVYFFFSFCLVFSWDDVIVIFRRLSRLPLVRQMEQTVQLVIACPYACGIAVPSVDDQ